MPALSQGLVEFANQHRQPAGPGIEVFETPRYRITLQPDYPIPGPNNVSWIRCGAADADEVIDEVRRFVASRRLPLMWTLDPETTPTDFAAFLERRGILPEPHAHDVKVMVLPIDADLSSVPVRGLELHDALADAETYRRSDAVNAEAFGNAGRGITPEQRAMQERRRLNALAAGNRRVFLASVDGEDAGSAGINLFPPHGAIINGGAVRPKFRGRGVYRALVTARLDVARRAGVAGLTVWGGRMSAPILEQLGFETVGWRKFYPDESTTAWSG